MINKEKHPPPNIRGGFVHKDVQMLHLENTITVYLRLSGMPPPLSPLPLPPLANLCFAGNGFAHGGRKQEEFIQRGADLD